MISLKLLLSCLITLINPAHDYLITDCNKIDVEVLVQDRVNDSDGGVTINLVKGDRSTVKYIFCTAKDGEVLNEGNFHNNALSGLKRGKYLCIVSTKDCTKKIEFTIE